MDDVIFIVGQYKCGTTWLLSALSAHPDVLGIREIDLIRAFYEGRPGEEKPKPISQRLRYIFGSNAWSPHDIEDALEHSRRTSSETAVTSPQLSSDLHPEDLRRLYKRLADTRDPERAMDIFLRAVHEPHSARTLVLKAADQIHHFNLLDELRPDSHKVLITRDGRDAAISAIAYRKLMLSLGRPWAKANLNYCDILKAWSKRARFAIDMARHRKLSLLRYEDLSSDFAFFFSRLLERLDLDSAWNTVEEIKRLTSFQAQTGRERGREKAHVLRKGAVGEWRTELSREVKDEAWKIAGDALEALGYTERGEVLPMPDGLS